MGTTKQPPGAFFTKKLPAANTSSIEASSLTVEEILGDGILH